MLCEYIQGRSTEVLLEDIRRFGYKGPVITDGLKQYLQIDNHGICWVHLIRNFKNVLKATGKSKKDDNALKLAEIYGKLSAAHYDLVDKLKHGELSKDDFIKQRKALSEPLIKEFYDKIDDIRSKYPESGLMARRFHMQMSTSLMCLCTLIMQRAVLTITALSKLRNAGPREERPGSSARQ